MYSHSDRLTGGYRLNPFFQCCLGGINRPHTCTAICSWQYAWGSPTPTSSLLLLLPKWLGKLESQSLGLGPVTSWMGACREIAHGVACSSLCYALEMHSSTSPVLPWRALLLRVSPNLVPRKATNALLRLMLEKVENYLFTCAASTEIGRLFHPHHAGQMEVAVGEVGTYAEKKNSEIRLSIDSDLSRKVE